VTGRASLLHSNPEERRTGSFNYPSTNQLIRPSAFLANQPLFDLPAEVQKREDSVTRIPTERQEELEVVAANERANN
jgi:hypothetical protein